MRNKIKKGLITLLLLFELSEIFFFSGTLLVQAAEFTDEVTPIFCSIANAVYNASWGIIAIAWIIVTVLFLMALGNPEKFNIAKKGVIVAVIGTVIILLGSLSIDIIERTMGATRGGTEPACKIKEDRGDFRVKCGNKFCGKGEICRREENQEWCEKKEK